MKIAISTRAFHETEGPGIASKNLVDKLIEIDRENDYLIVHKDCNYDGRYKEYDNVEEVIVKVKSKFIFDQIYLPIISKRKKVDLIFSTKFTVPLFSSIRAITMMRGSEYWVYPEYYDKLDLMYVNFFIPLYCKKAKLVITLSDLLKEDIHKYIKVPMGKMVTVYSAAHDRFKKIDDKDYLESIRIKYNLPKGKYVLSVTRPYPSVNSKSKKLYSGKNIDGIIRSFDMCRKWLKDDVKLVLVGKRVKEVLLDNGYANIVDDGNSYVFPGPVLQEDIPAVYAMASVMVFPSYYESFGLPIVEAMACGCPVITSNVGACPEVAGDAALFAAPDDINGLAEALKRVLVDEGLSDCLRNAGFERAKLFTWERSALTLKNIFMNFK